MMNQENKLRSLIFSFIAIVIIPLLILACLEVGLRLGGYGFDPHFVKKSHENGQDVLRKNPRFSESFFPRNIAKLQRPLSTLFTAHKPSGTFRIFVLGESAAIGYPSPQFSFSRILEVLLRDQFPDVRFEVINTGLTAINSHAIRNITKDLAPWEADLFIVYMGNNEVVGPYGPGTVFSPLVSNLFLLRTIQALKTTRIGQLLTDAAAIVNSEDPSGPTWGGMQVFFNKRVRADDVRMKKVYAHFQNNLKDILVIARGSGAQILVSSVVGNLEGIAPFASQHKLSLSESDEAKWDELYQSGIAHESRGEYEAAVQQFIAAAQIDNDFADLHFRLGRDYLALSNDAAAQESFVKARDLDTLRFRPDTRINKIIKEVADQRENDHIYFLDAETIFVENSTHGVTNDDLFYDHVHFNFAGNYLLAKEMLGKLQPHLPAWILDTQQERRPLLTRKECEDLLAFTGYNQHEIMVSLADNLMNKLPFTNMINYTDMIRRKREQEQFLSYYRTPQGLAEAAEAHRSALTRNPDRHIHLSLSRILRELNEPEEALEQMRRAEELMPNPELKEIIRQYESEGRAPAEPQAPY